MTNEETGCVHVRKQDQLFFCACLCPSANEGKGGKMRSCFPETSIRKATHTNHTEQQNNCGPGEGAVYSPGLLKPLLAATARASHGSYFAEGEGGGQET